MARTSATWVKLCGEIFKKSPSAASLRWHAAFFSSQFVRPCRLTEVRELPNEKNPDRHHSYSQTAANYVSRLPSCILSSKFCLFSRTHWRVDRSPHTTWIVSLSIAYPCTRNVCSPDVLNFPVNTTRWALETCWISGISGYSDRLQFLPFKWRAASTAKPAIVQFINNIPRAKCDQRRKYLFQNINFNNNRQFRWFQNPLLLDW